MIGFVRFGLAAGMLMAAGRQAPSPPAPPWGIGMERAPWMSLPPAVFHLVASDLEYEPGDSVRGVRFDFNRDGRREYLIQSSTRLCGTGGCAYLLVDGASGTQIGQFSGAPLYVQARRVRGFPIIQTWSHLSAASGTWTTYAFTGTRYRITRQRLLQGAAVDRLFAALRGVPIWRAQR